MLSSRLHLAALEFVGLVIRDFHQVLVELCLSDVSVAWPLIELGSRDAAYLNGQNFFVNVGINCYLLGLLCRAWL